MARPYAGEMTRLSETFQWAAAADIQPLCRAIRIAGLSPLRAIGSGGSLTGAHALAGLHQRYTGYLAAALLRKSKLAPSAPTRRFVTDRSRTTLVDQARSFD